MAIIDSRKIIRRLDASIGYWIGKLLALIPTPQPQDNAPKRIIFIKLWGIGESILTLPALAALKEKYPTSTISVLTTPYPATVFSNQAFIDELIIRSFFRFPFYVLGNMHEFAWSIDGEPYAFFSAIAAFLLGRKSTGFATCKRSFLYTHPVSYNNEQHVIKTYGDLLGVIPTALIPITYSSDDKEVVMQRISEMHVAEHERILLIAPTVGGSATSRMWPRERFIELINELNQLQYTRIIVIGSMQDKHFLHRMKEKISSDIEIVTDLSVHQAAYLASLGSLTIANDSGFMHIAAAAGAPVIGLFGPNTPLRFGPYNTKSRPIYHPCPQSPHIHVHQGIIPETVCACMENIKVREVIAVATHMLMGYDIKL